MARPSITQLPPTGLDRFRGLLTRADDLTGGLLAAVPGIGTLAALNRSGNAAQAGDYTKAVESLTDVVPVGRLASNAIRGITRGRSAGDIGGVLNAGGVKDIENSWQSRGIKGAISERGDKITLSKIIVPQEARGSGLGKQAMSELLKYADANQKTVALTPSSDFGGNKSRLIDFYKRLGFEQNKGKSKDYEISESMLRRPQALGIQGGAGQGVDTRAMNQYPQQDALDLAQKRAALPVSEGGLGLPENNTPMDRARAMGYVTPAFRGTTADEAQLKDRTFASDNVDVANSYAGYLKDFADDPVMLEAMQKLTPNGNVMPLLVRDVASAKARTNAPDYEMILNSNQARSRFAAFDPFRRNENDLLAFRGNMASSNLLNINPLLGLLDYENQ